MNKRGDKVHLLNHELPVILRLLEGFAHNPSLMFSESLKHDPFIKLDEYMNHFGIKSSP